MHDLNGKVAIVTGASRGIGAATAIELARCGASVVLAARTVEQISDLANRIENTGGKAIPVQCDVANFQSVKEAVDKSLTISGALDIFVGNAGVIDPISPLSSSNPESWSQTVDINFKGIYHGLRAVLPVMQKQNSGTIINISSGAAHAPLEGWSHYCSAKAGAAMLTQCAHLENMDTGIRIFGLSPGTVATYMQTAIKASGINPVSQLDPSVHVPAEWPAKAITWLCTKDADAYMGQEIALKDEVIRKRIGLI